MTLSIGSNPSGGTLSGTTTVAAVDGVATFADLSINNVGNGYTLVASSPGLTGATSNPFNITPPPDLTITKTHVGNFGAGEGNAQYTITVSNIGGGSTRGTVTVTDTLPAGLTATNFSGTGWTCNLGTLTCTRSDALAVNSSYPPITLTVRVANSAPSSVTNTATVSGGGDTSTPNNTANDVTTITACVANPVVTTNADSGAGSLRQALATACDGRTITFAGGVSSPVTLASELVINRSLTTQGPGATALTISGNNAVRVFDVAAGNFNVSISGLTIANGRVSNSGNSGGAFLTTALAW